MVGRTTKQTNTVVRATFRYGEPRLKLNNWMSHALPCIIYIVITSGYIIHTPAPPGGPHPCGRVYTMMTYAGSMWQIEWRTNSVSSCTYVGMARLRSYLVDCCIPVTDVVGRQRLRSATQQLMAVTRHRLSTVGRRAFAVHGPMVWNSLSDDLRAHQDYESFRQGLKNWL